MTKTAEVVVKPRVRKPRVKAASLVEDDTSVEEQGEVLCNYKMVNGPVNFKPPEDTILSFTMTSNNALRTIFDSLKDMPPDVVINATSSGLSMINTADPTCIILLNIAASDLGNYCCKQPCALGIRTVKFSQMLRTINSKDSIALYILESDSTNLNICVVNENALGYSRMLIIPLLEARSPNSSLVLPNDMTTCKLLATKLQKILKDTLAIGTTKLGLVKTPGFLKVESQIADYRQEIYQTVTDCSESVNKAPIVGRYNIFPLKAFVKAIMLSRYINVSMAIDRPLIMRYEFFENSHYTLVIHDVRTNV